MFQVVFLLCHPAYPVFSRLLRVHSWTSAHLKPWTAQDVITPCSSHSCFTYPNSFVLWKNLGSGAPPSLPPLLPPSFPPSHQPRHTHTTTPTTSTAILAQAVSLTVLPLLSSFFGNSFMWSLRGSDREEAPHLTRSEDGQDQGGGERDELHGDDPGDLSFPAGALRGRARRGQRHRVEHLAVQFLDVPEPMSTKSPRIYRIGERARGEGGGRGSARSVQHPGGRRFRGQQRQVPAARGSDRWCWTFLLCSRLHGCSACPGAAPR